MISQDFGVLRAAVLGAECVLGAVVLGAVLDGRQRNLDKVRSRA
jgi:hypothetical protein